MENKVKSISLNGNEESVLLQIIDIALKAGGLELAEAAVHFKRKLSQAKALELPKVETGEKEVAEKTS